MANLYRITPLEKKSVEAFYDVYKVLPNGEIKGWNVTETWRWGQGFRELDNLPMSFECDPERMHGVHCQASAGWGAELDDLCSVYFDFTDNFTDEEKAAIEEFWYNGDPEDPDQRYGAAWLFDYQEEWEMEDDHIRILPPLKIDLVDEHGYGDTAIIKENIDPEDPDLPASNTWPFPIA